MIAETGGTFLYTNNGKCDYVISEGTGLLHMNYFYDLMSPTDNPTDEDRLTFSMQSSVDYKFNQLLVAPTQLNPNISFAVESLINEDGESSKSLEHLVKYSYGAIIIRELTDQEQSRLEKFKEKQQECE